MAVDAFLKIDGITGESTNFRHKGEIEVLAYSWNIKQSIGSATGGAGAGKVQISDFTIHKRVDASSPALFAAVCSGEHFRDALFTVEETAARGNPMAFLKIKFSDVLISSFTTGGGGGDQPTDQVSLNFAKIEMETVNGHGGTVHAESCDLNRLE